MTCATPAPEGAAPGAARRDAPDTDPVTLLDTSGTVVVVGAGIAGVECARQLHRAGVPVRLLDRGHRISGRMGARTVDSVQGRHVVDLGASYFTVRDDEFREVADDWERRGLARPWTDTFHLSDGTRLVGTKVGPVRWAAGGGLRSLVEDLADGLDVVHPYDAVEVVRDGDGVRVDGQRYRAAVLAMPDPQVRDLVDPALGDELLGSEAWAWRPTVAVLAGWSGRWWPELDGVFVSDSPVVEWVADDGRRRGDDAPVLVAHTTGVFAARHLDDPAEAVTPVLAALGEVLGRHQPVPEPEWARAHRWSLASPTRPRPAPDFVLDTTGTVGVCGDGWGERSRVEAAWLSGHRLGRELAARLGGRVEQAV
ncbi:NAD(P)/FAD-dependent oxidoreductase [Aquipuribacter nitratireducens]|uniref:NAD(P)/FAD-dependent oxidoreductase n=1 Tax=Aquipuribacter nitratireducens TaxID=650104 RepID=A0ABW0GPE1_9MICO